MFFGNLRKRIQGKVMSKAMPPQFRMRMGSMPNMGNPFSETANPFVGLAQPLVNFDITLFNLSLPLPPACVIALSASFEGNFFEAFSTGTVGDAISGSVQLTYPTVGTATDTSVRFTHDFDTFEFFSLEADESYTNAFLGWYKQFPTGSESNRITTSSTLTIFYENEATLGNKFYAVFD